MAKLECYLNGDFNEILRRIDSEIKSGSISADLEDSSRFSGQNVRCAVMVYERYSWSGSNRVSLNVTLVSDGHRTFLSAITSGGSQAMFFKINTIGEEAFLDKLAEAVRPFR